MGSRPRNGAPQARQRGDRRPGLLLRSPESLATRHAREHQRLAAAILPERHGSVDGHAGAAQRDRAPPEHAPAEDVRIHDTRGETRGHRCNDRLNPPGPEFGELTEVSYPALQITLRPGA